MAACAIEQSTDVSSGITAGAYRRMPHACYILTGKLLARAQVTIVSGHTERIMLPNHCSGCLPSRVLARSRAPYGGGADNIALITATLTPTLIHTALIVACGGHILDGCSQNHASGLALLIQATSNKTG